MLQSNSQTLQRNRRKATNVTPYVAQTVATAPRLNPEQRIHRVLLNLAVKKIKPLCRIGESLDSNFGQEIYAEVSPISIPHTRCQLACREFFSYPITALCFSVNRFPLYVQGDCPSPAHAVPCTRPPLPATTQDCGTAPDPLSHFT